MLTPKDWLLHAREALYDPDPARRFEYDVEPDGDSMQASTRHGQGSRLKSHAGHKQRAFSRTRVVNRPQTAGKRGTNNSCAWFECQAVHVHVQLEWSAEYDGGQPIVCLCTLEPSQDTATTLSYMLSHLCKSYKVLKVSSPCTRLSA